jgi:hypothetical protein
MSKQHPIDELFRSKLENHAFEAPMGLWENIDKKRNRKRILIGRFGGGRLLIVAGVLLLLGLSTWFVVQPDKNASAHNLPSETQETILSDTEHLNNQQGASDIDMNNSEVSNNQTDASKEDEKDSNTEIQTTKTDNAENKIIAGITDEAGLNNTIVNEEVNSGNTRDGGVAPLKYEKVAKEESTGSTSIAKVIPSEEIHEVNKEDFLTSHGENISATYSMVKTVEGLPDFSKLLSTEAAGSHDFTTKETDCPTFKGLPGGIYMDLNASINIAQRTMTSKDPETDDYLLEREKTEIPYFSFSAGMQITALTERGFAFKTGVDYTQISEAFNFEGGEETWIHISEAGDTTIRVGTRKVKATNSYQMVDIPLLAGYEMDFSNFSLSVYGGPFINVMFSKKGNLISQETMEPVGITTGEIEKFSENFRPRLGLGWYTSFGFAYKLQGGIQIRIEPYFRFYPKSFSTTEFVIDQRYFLTGMKVGIRKRL